MKIRMLTCALRAAAVAVAVFLCLAACQGGKENSLDKIKKAGHIKIAMGPGYPPFAYLNAKQELVGFDVTMAKELARRMGVEAKLVAVDWAETPAPAHKKQPTTARIKRKRLRNIFLSLLRNECRKRLPTGHCTPEPKSDHEQGQGGTKSNGVHWRP